MKGFSIIVCCYNSEKVIVDTFQHLEALTIPSGFRAEVILVDNQCTDNTVQLALDTWKGGEGSFNLKVVEEPVPGLSYARITGAASSQFDYLLFCDDDNRLSPEYLLIADSILRENREIAILGGLGIPDYESKPGYWPEDFYIYGCGPQAKYSGKVNYVHGAGVIFRRDAFHKIMEVPFKFLLTDRKENQLTSGGDHELCYAIGLWGGAVWYESKLRFNHYIPADRLTKDYCKRFIRESAPAIDILDIYRYLLQHDHFNPLFFYGKRLKIIAYHIYGICLSKRSARKYPNNVKIEFLESFHIYFHKTRIKCILMNFFHYPKWARRIEAFKDSVADLTCSGS